MADAIGDPDARFQAVRGSGVFLCGEVNGGERAREGYVRFVYEEAAGAASIDPGDADGQLPIAVGDPACGKSFAYQSVEERLGCAAAPERERKARLKREFEALWQRACG